VSEGDSIVIPAGHLYRLMNQSAAPVRFTIGNAPGYLV
jgi:mannose-6-phosphate isomerase-like protein (cupin superfamily)